MRLALFIIILATCCGCELTSTGGYLHGSSTNEAFGGAHAAIAGALAPTLNSNNCILLDPSQTREYQIEREVTETIRSTGSSEETKGRDEYLLANNCSY